MLGLVHTPCPLHTRGSVALVPLQMGIEQFNPVYPAEHEHVSAEIQVPCPLHTSGIFVEFTPKHMGTEQLNPVYP
jgi:hypothetical protein